VYIYTLSIFLGPKIRCMDETLSAIIYFLYEHIANVFLSAYTLHVLITEDHTKQLWVNGLFIADRKICSMVWNSSSPGLSTFTMSEIAQGQNKTLSQKGFWTLDVQPFSLSIEKATNEIQWYLALCAFLHDLRLLGASCAPKKAANNEVLHNLNAPLLQAKLRL
jgi:hypothetical protein